MRPRNRPKDLIQSVDRALQILDTLVESGTGLTVRQVADVLGLKPATAHHLVNTLEYAGFVVRRGSVFSVDSAKVLEYYAALTRSVQADPVGLATIRKLADRTMETVYLAAWSGDHVTVTAVAEGSHAVRVTDVYPGLRGLEHARASGKALLAQRSDEDIVDFLSRAPLEARTTNTIVTIEAFLEEIDEIRVRGYAIDREEYSPGVTCLAAVLAHGGQPTTNAVALTMPTSRYIEHGDSLASELMAAAQSPGTD